MALQAVEPIHHTMGLQVMFAPVYERCLIRFPSFYGASLTGGNSCCCVTRKKSIRLPLMVLFLSSLVPWC